MGQEISEDRYYNGLWSNEMRVTVDGPERRARGWISRIRCQQVGVGKPESLSHKELVRRASSLVTGSSNTFLTQTTLALLDSLQNYTKVINNLVLLHKRYVASISKLSPAEEEAIWQVILRQRQELIQRQKDCERFESCWETAINLSEVAAEAAFNAGADHASVTVQNNLQVAQSQVKQAKQLSMQAEKELKDSKADRSKRRQISLSTGKEEDEDIPDAYLRED